MIMTRVSFTASRCYTRRVVSPTARRLLSRVLLVGGTATIAIMLARSCEDRGDGDVTIVVDPRPLGETVRAVRVDVFDRKGARGSTERRYERGEAPEAVRLRTPALGDGGELVIEVERDGGAQRVQRVRRTVDAPAGSTVRVQLGALPEP
jgi:hypothetical protein